MFFHNDLLLLCQKKKRKITELFPDTTVYYYSKIALKTNGIKKYKAINQSYHIIHTVDLRQTLPKYIITFFHENAVLMIGITDQSDYST